MFNTPHPAISLLFSFGLMVLIVLPLLAWLLLHGQHDNKAKLWFAGTGFYAFTALLFSLQYRLPAWLAFDVGTTSTVVFYFLMHEAMRREISHTPTRWTSMGVFTCLFGAVYGYIDWLGLRPTLGLLLHSVVFTVLAFFNLRMALTLQQHFQSRACWVMAFAFLLALGVNGTRTLMIIFTGDTVPLLTYTALSNAFLMSIFLGAICYSFGYWGFVLEKTRQERVQEALKTQLAQERQAAAEAVAQELTELVHQRDHMVMLNSRFATINSLTMFNTAIVHEISQPLQAIQLCLEGLRMRTMQANAPLEHLSGIDSALGLVDKLGLTVKALRQLISSQRPNLTMVPVTDLLQDVIAIIQAECERQQVRLVANILTTTGFLLVDKVLLERVLLNMVANALESLAMDPMRPSEAVLQLQTDVEQSPSQAHWVLSLQDNGPGFADGMLALITSPFQSHKETGMGIGLALAHLLVRQWQGELSARNLSGQEGRGARVVVRIPMSEAQP
ncbi:MAG: sensor histidine kinase [Betaproteobacteria bacterium]|nr:sensor histidine kinase [Betaproteobacteria bacterium]